MRDVAVVGLALLAAACATSPGPGPRTAASVPLRAASFDEAVEAWESYCRGLDTLRASGELEVRDERTGKGRSLGVRLVAGRGGRLYVKGSVAVVTALEVVADGHRFWFQVPSRKTVWTGRSGGAARAEAGDEQAPYQALRPADVLQALLPESILPADGEVLLLDGSREAWVLSLSRPAGSRGTLRRRVVLDRRTLRPAGLRTYDEAGDIASDVVLRVGEDGLPRSVSITRPHEGYFARLTLEGVERNVVLPAQAFVPRVPQDWKVVDVDEEPS